MNTKGGKKRGEMKTCSAASEENIATARVTSSVESVWLCCVIPTVVLCDMQFSCSLLQQLNGTAAATQPLRQTYECGAHFFPLHTAERPPGRWHLLYAMRGFDLDLMTGDGRGLDVLSGFAVHFNLPGWKWQEILLLRYHHSALLLCSAKQNNDMYIKNWLVLFF